jgi:hypothetical protein
MDPIESTAVPDLAELKAKFKSTAFNRELRLLIQQAGETIRARYGVSIELGEVRAELTCLNKFETMYTKMKPEEFYQYFENIFTRKRSEILNSIKDDRWIRTGRISIQIGEGGKKELVEKLKQHRIMLSDIFLIACDLQTQCEKSLDGLDEQFTQGAGGKDLIRPNILLLHIMRIFYHLTDGEDKKALGNIVTQLETDLSLKTRTVGSEPWIKHASANPAGGTGTAFSGIFNMATNLMEKMGYTPPAGMKPPSETEITDVIGKVFNNSTTQAAIQNMFTSLQGCQDFGSAMQTVVNNVTDPATMEAIKSSVAETGYAAVASGAPKAPGPDPSPHPDPSPAPTPSPPDAI